MLGGFVERDGTDVLMVFTMVALGLLIVVTYLYKKPENAADSGEKPEKAAAGTGDRADAEPLDGAHRADRAEDSGDGSFTAFFRKYRRFMLFILGTTLCFFSHNMLNDYLIQIVRSLGGGETQLGYATFLSAILELPVMALIGLVLKRIMTLHFFTAPFLHLVLREHITDFIWMVTHDELGMKYDHDSQYSKSDGSATFESVVYRLEL